MAGRSPAHPPAPEPPSRVLAAVEEAFRETADDALAEAVRRLSDLYTTGRGALARDQADAAHLAAKREYFLASDAPKVGLVLDACVGRSASFAGLLEASALEIVDLGAGVGATSVGFIDWLARHGRTPRLSFRAVEAGRPAAHAYREAVEVAARAAGIDCTIEVVARDFREATPPACDLLLCQTALNELLVTHEHEPRTLDLVEGWSRHAPLVLIEPALRHTTRALMALRDTLLERGAASIAAPCPHQSACPMRARVDDWCHEARPIARTPRVEAIDRLVGRRDGRSLFSYLATVPPSAQAPPRLAEGAMRLVTGPLGSRGKTERIVCRPDGELRLVRLLDRETSEANRAFLSEPQGAMVVAEPVPPRDRIGPEITIRPDGSATD